MIYKLLNGDLIEIENTNDETNELAHILGVYRSQILLSNQDNTNITLVLILPHSTFEVSAMSPDQIVWDEWPRFATNESVLAAMRPFLHHIPYLFANPTMAAEGMAFLERIYDRNATNSELHELCVAAFNMNPTDVAVEWVLSHPAHIRLTNLCANPHPNACAYIRTRTTLLRFECWKVLFEHSPDEDLVRHAFEYANGGAMVLYLEGSSHPVGRQLLLESDNWHILCGCECDSEMSNKVWEKVKSSRDKKFYRESHYLRNRVAKIAACTDDRVVGELYEMWREGDILLNEAMLLANPHPTWVAHFLTHSPNTTSGRYANPHPDAVKQCKEWLTANKREVAHHFMKLWTWSPELARWWYDRGDDQPSTLDILRVFARASEDDVRIKIKNH